MMSSWENFHLSTWKTSYFLGKPAGFAGVPETGLSVSKLGTSSQNFAANKCQGCHLRGFDLRIFVGFLEKDPFENLQS